MRATWNGPRPFYVGSGLGFANVLGFGETRTVMAPGYVDLELQLTWVFKPWLKFFLNGFNLLNQKASQIDYYYASLLRNEIGY